ncbi:MAG: GNAT family N-acetyltransferase [Candidatus Baltobacteraceae bacterium]
MKIEIRRAVPRDRAFVRDLGERTAMDSVSATRQADAVAVRENYERLLDIVFSQSHVALIADVEGGPAGFFLMLDQMPDEVTGEAQGFIAYMAVEPGHRDAGVGTALLERGEDEARTRGLPYMALMVTEDNAAARALYARAGFLTERRLLCKML